MNLDQYPANVQSTLFNISTLMLKRDFLKEIALDLADMDGRTSQELYSYFADKLPYCPLADRGYYKDLMVATFFNCEKNQGILTKFFQE